jgi:hypothetical protein
MPLISPTIQLAREEGKEDLIIKLLKRRIGEINPSVIEQVKALDIDSLDGLGEALLDFSTIYNLEKWLESRLEPVEE